jgi:hypothetical protein
VPKSKFHAISGPAPQKGRRHRFSASYEGENFSAGSRLFIGFRNSRGTIGLAELDPHTGRD